MAILSRTLQTGSRIGIVLLLPAFFAACSPAARDAVGGTSVALPTATLIPATPLPSDTPIPPTPTAGTETGILASDLIAASTPTDPPAAVRGQPTEIADPVAAQLAALARRLLAEELDLPQQRVRVTDVQPYTWGDSSLGCPLPGQNYTQVETNGYRLILEAGEREYFYHTDVDRVIPCAPENEVLPAGTPTPRPTSPNRTPGVTPQAVG